MWEYDKQNERAKNNHILFFVPVWFVYRKMLKWKCSIIVCIVLSTNQPLQSLFLVRTCIFAKQTPPNVFGSLAVNLICTKAIICSPCSNGDCSNTCGNKTNTTNLPNITILSSGWYFLRVWFVGIKMQKWSTFYVEKSVENKFVLDLAFLDF